MKGPAHNKGLWFNVITFIIAFALAFYVTSRFLSGNGSKAKAHTEQPAGTPQSK